MILPTGVRPFASKCSGSGFGSRMLRVSRPSKWAKNRSTLLLLSPQSKTWKKRHLLSTITQPGSKSETVNRSPQEFKLIPVLTTKSPDDDSTYSQPRISNAYWAALRTASRVALGNSTVSLYFAGNPKAMMEHYILTLMIREPRFFASLQFGSWTRPIACRNRRRQHHCISGLSLAHHN